MALYLAVTDLLDYTDWERDAWHASLTGQGAAALKVGAGSHGDGRFHVVGDVIRHIFSAEQRYVERLTERPLTDTSTIPNDDVEALFAFGRQSRAALRALIDSFPAGEWDRPREFTLMKSTLTLTPRKIVIHVLIHEMRHWAQVATLLRLSGVKGEFRDFLFSPIQPV